MAYVQVCSLSFALLHGFRPWTVRVGSHLHSLSLCFPSVSPNIIAYNPHDTHKHIDLNSKLFIMRLPTLSLALVTIFLFTSTTITVALPLTNSTVYPDEPTIARSGPLDGASQAHRRAHHGPRKDWTIRLPDTEEIEANPKAAS